MADDQIREEIQNLGEGAGTYMLKMDGLDLFPVIRSELGIGSSTLFN